MNHKLFIPALGLGAFVLGGAAVANIAKAEDTDSYPSIVQKLAEKFNLNLADVEAVFDEDREERHAEMETTYEKRLSHLVSDGKITEQQKDVILEKHREMEANRQANWQEMQTMSEAERKSKMEEEQQVLKDWASQYGIDLDYLLPFGMIRGPGHWMKM